MKTMMEVLETLMNQDLEQYKEVMEYCSGRVTEDEGIPTVIGLDDLTSSWDTVYQGPEADEEFHMRMAAGAMVFASLYEELGPEELGHYPGIAPAMSAMTEMFFHTGEDGETIPYRQVIQEFLKK